ncbi:hypothetical protein HAX54_034517 [Datura stramonium]|uniref:Uncharacterized protein n=1 Tax=Datura stramonium TaxID=4076 RepID=A0ABS8VE72_DATST|nr:hypothetical protein [Datura stramonium]
MEMESLRPKLVSHDELLQLMNKGREDLKASLEGTFKSMYEELRENNYQENIKDLLSLLRAMPNKLEMCILQLQTDLSKTLAKEIQIIALRPDCHGQKHETAPVDPPKGINDCSPPREVKFLKKKGNVELPLNLMRILTQAFPSCLKKMEQSRGDCIPFQGGLSRLSTHKNM